MTAPSKPEVKGIVNKKKLEASLKKLAPFVCPHLLKTGSTPNGNQQGGLCSKGPMCSYLHPSPSFRRNTCRHFENGRCERSHFSV